MTAQPYRFDYNPMHIGQYVQQGFDKGFQQGQQRKLNNLAAQAYSDPMNASGAIQQAIATDSDYGQKLAHWNDQQKQDFMQKAAGAAQYLLNARQSNNPAAIEGAYQSVKPWLQKLTDIHGGNLPDHWDDAALPGLHQIVANAGGSMSAGQDGIVVGGRLVDRRTGKEMYSPPSYQLKEDRDGNLYRVPVNPGAQPEMVFGQGTHSQAAIPSNTPVTDANGAAVKFTDDVPQAVRQALLQNPDSAQLDLGRVGGSPKFGKPENVPSGYRMGANGSLEPIPGGPADKEKAESFRTMTASEVQEMGLPAGTIAQMSPKGQVQIVNKPKDMPNAAGGQVIQNEDGTVTFIPSGKVSEQERNAAGFYSRMVSADAELEKLTQAGYDPTNIKDYMTVGSRFLNGMASDNGQLYHQAAQNWVRANLRKESGAAIGVAEMDQEIKNYFPQFGDSPAVIKQKADTRKVVENAMRTAAGNAMPPPQQKGASQLQGGDRTRQVLQLLNEARDAIRQGADKEAVKQRLIQQGLTNIAGRL